MPGALQTASPPAGKPSRRSYRVAHRNAAIVMAIAITLACVFVISYSLALGRPTPHHIPAALVGPRQADQRLVRAIERATDVNLALTPMSTLAQARQAIEDQRIYAALVMEPGHARLLVTSASGLSVARVLEQAAQSAGRRSQTRLQVTDVHPLPPKDPQGLVAFYVTIAATLLGFVSMFQLRANTDQLTLREWLGCIGIISILGGLLLALVTDPLLGALSGPFAELWALLSAQIAVAALFNATMLTLFGKWAFIPTWTLFVAVGNAASGGAVAPPLLPAFYAFIGRFLPNGATVQAIRNAVYFRSNQHLEPIVAEVCWLVVMLAGLLAAARRRGRTPSTA